jgi:hypothetical protein
LPTRIRGDEPRRNFAAIKLPNGSETHSSAVGRSHLSFHYEARPEAGLNSLNDFIVSGVFVQYFGQYLPSFSLKSKLAKEARLARAVTMRWIEQIVSDLFPLNDQSIKLRQFHFTASSTILISSGVSS